MQAYRAAGIAIPRTTYNQVYAGQPVYTTDQIAPGDLLFIEGSDPGPGGAPGHVGLYIGGNTIIDAPHSGANVQLTTLSAWIHQLVATRAPRRPTTSSPIRVCRRVDMICRWTGVGPLPLLPPAFTRGRSAGSTPAAPDSKSGKSPRSKVISAPTVRDRGVTAADRQCL